MSLVSASPSAVGALAATLDAGAQALLLCSARLSETTDRFAASLSEFGPTRTAVPGLLRVQHRGIAALGFDLDRFVSGLLAADAAGVGLAVGRVAPGSGDLIVTSALAVEANIPLVHDASLDDVIESMRAQRDLHLARPPVAGPFPSAYRTWAEQLVRRNRELHQLEAIAAPRFDGWAGVSVGQWTSWPALSEARHLGQQLASSRLRAADTGPGISRPPDLSPRAAFAPAHPFLSAALDHGALLTPDRVAVLDDLDALVTMPLDQFLRARAHARDGRPFFDWTADGCSGPIPVPARDTCLRHDFLYRNARMIRDQWGVADAFATDVKAHADALFGRELNSSFARWQRWTDGTLWVWLEGAELAVEWFGDVGEPWNPPPPGAFFGSVEPG